MTPRTTAITGFIAAGALLTAVAFLAEQRKRSGPAVVPPIHILAPRHGADVTNPVTLHFTTPADLRLSTRGWNVDDLHLHSMVDGAEIMPAAADIQQHDSTFSWRLPPLPPGRHRLYLTWAARHHGNVAGVTDTIEIVVRKQ